MVCWKQETLFQPSSESKHQLPLFLLCLVGGAREQVSPALQLLAAGWNRELETNPGPPEWEIPPLSPCPQAMCM